MRRILLSVSAAAAANAEPATIRAEVDRHQVTQDGLVRLEVTIEAPRGYDRYEPPDVADFSVIDTGRKTQTQVLMQGGRWQVQSSEVYTYLLRARRGGVARIGPAKLHADGGVVETPTIAVQVSAAAVPPPAPPAPSQSAPSQPSTPPSPFGGSPFGPSSPFPPPPSPMSSFDEPEVGEADVFLQAVADRTDVFAGEQVTATWLLYARTDVSHFAPTVDPRTDDFWGEDLYTPAGRLAWETQVVGGQTYRVATVLKKALFPLRDGALTVGAMEAQIRAGFGGFFGTDVVVRRSPELRVTARPTPIDGRPAGFDPAHVGRFDIAASIDRTDAGVGEPVVLRVVVRGTGNIRGLRPPPLAADGFRVYDPRSDVRVEPGDRVGGEQRIEYVLVPQRDGVLTIPPIRLACFDPEARAYREAATAPIAVTVVGRAAVGTADAPPQAVVGPDIRPIRHRGPRVVRAAPVYRTPLFFALLAVGPAAWLGAIAGGLVRSRLRRDTPRSRLRRACRRAADRLRLAERSMRSPDAAAFFGDVERALREPLSEQLGRRVEGMTRDDLRATLAERGAGDLADDLLGELDNCDFARYAPAPARGDEMAASLRRARALLRRMERLA